MPNGDDSIADNPSREDYEYSEKLNGATGQSGLLQIRDVLNLLATGDETDGAELRRKLCLVGPHLDRIIASMQAESKTLIERIRATTTQAQQAQLAAEVAAQQAQLDADLERARGRIEPIKSTTNPDPHRVDWKNGVGF